MGTIKNNVKDLMAKVSKTNLFSNEAFLAGKWISANSGNFEKKAVTNPANGEFLCEVPMLGITEVRQAIEKAETAQKEWAKKPAKERGAILKRMANILVENKKDLGLLMTLEQGKPLAEAEGEILYAASFLDWFAEEARRVYGDVISGIANDRRILAIKQPVGVTAAITPWNFPSAMIARKLGAALAAGCAMVIKPASETPLSAFVYGKIAEIVGLPHGLVSILTGNSSLIGKELTTNPLVRKLSFTGSTEIGKVLMAQSANGLKKLSLELGGNAPFIVFADADLDAAVEGAVASKYRNNGQACTCTNRIYLQSGIYQEFIKKYVAKVKDLKVGSGLEDGINLGPLINMEAMQKVELHVEDALKKGAKLATGGKKHSLGGNFFEPTVLCDVDSTMLVAKEEIFGPLAPISKFESEQEVIELANNTEYGLSAFFYTRDIGLAWRVGEALEYGMVGINAGLISLAEAPFGGIKQSGFGREGSKYGLDDYLNIKYLCIAGVDK